VCFLLGYGDGQISQGRAADTVQIQLDYLVFHITQYTRDTRGSEKLATVTLSVIETERIAGVALCLGHSQYGGGIKSPRD
jgi:hypothetical protein